MTTMGPKMHLHGRRPNGRFWGGAGVAGALVLLLLAGCCRMPVPSSAAEAVDFYRRRGERAYAEGRYPEAAAAWHKGLDAAHSAQRAGAAAGFMVDLSRAEEGMGQYAAALDHASSALELLGEGGAPATRCRALIQKGLAHRRMARYAAARPYFDRALEIARRLADPRLESESLRNIAALLQDQGQLDAALPYYHQAIGLARAHGDEASEARSLNNLGLLFDARAAYPEALDHLGASLALRRKIGDRAGEGRVLGNLCIVHAKLNQLDQALECCQAALEIAEDIGDRQREANHLNNIGTLHRRMDRPRSALRYYRRSLAIKRELSDPAGEARALNNIGETYWRLGKLEDAEEYLAGSLAIKIRIGDLPGQSAVCQNLALISSRRGAYAKAKSYYMQAVFLNSRTGRPELTWRAYDGLSYIYEALSRPELAILYGKQALRSIQETRARMEDLDKALRRSYLDDKERVYRHVADLLIREGRLPEAQQVVSLLKEEEYRHFLDTRGVGDATVDDVVATMEERHWIEKTAAFEGELGRVGREIEDLETMQQRRELTGEEQTRLFALYDRADEVHLAFEDYLRELESAYADKVAFGEKDLVSLESLQGELGRFGQRTVIVTFLVLEENVSILVTAPAVQIPHRIAISEGELNRRIFAFREALVRPRRDPRPPARALHDLLISPIEADLVALDAETLMISLDGALRYIPFAALFDGDQYLAEHYNLVLFAPAAKKLFGEAGTAAPRVAGLGMSDAAEGFRSLPAVAKELDIIVREEETDDPRGVLPGRILLNRNFTAAGLSEMLRRGYPIIHIASHFAFRPGTAADSFMLLGDGSRLTLLDLESRRYPFRFIDLLTLSACETAVGGEDARGREIESFAALTQKRGAGAILATLWPVADVSTGTFMALFYQLRDARQFNKAEALREVQLMFLAGEHDMVPGERDPRGVGPAEEGEGGFEPPPGAPYAHPFYWAPFVLMGNFL